MMKNITISSTGIFLVIIILVVGYGCSTNHTDRLKDEKDFQRAFYNQYFQGKGALEVPVQYGRIDILTPDFAVEVDRLSKFHEGIGQALHYAKETGRRPGLALFVINPDAADHYVRKLCHLHGIRVWYINEELKMTSVK